MLLWWCVLLLAWSGGAAGQAFEGNTSDPTFDCHPDEQAAMNGGSTYFLGGMAFLVFSLGGYCVFQVHVQASKNAEDEAAIAQAFKLNSRSSSVAENVKNMDTYVKEQQAKEQNVAGAAAVAVGGVALAILFGDQLKAAFSQAFENVEPGTEQVLGDAKAAAEQLSRDGTPLATEAAQAVTIALARLSDRLPAIQLAQLQSTAQKAAQVAFDHAPDADAAARAALQSAVATLGSSPEALAALAAASDTARAAGEKLYVALTAAAEKGASVPHEALEAALQMKLAAAPLAAAAVDKVQAGVEAASTKLTKVNLQELHSAMQAVADTGAQGAADFFGAVGPAFSELASSGFVNASSSATGASFAATAAPAAGTTDGIRASLKVSFPPVKAGAKWVKDAGFAAGLAAGDAVQAGKSCCSEFIEKYGVDTKIFEIIRDWCQIMSLIFSAILPPTKTFTAICGLFFNAAALDLAAIFRWVVPDKETFKTISGHWELIIYSGAISLLIAFSYLECTQRSNPDAIDDGVEMQSYAAQGKYTVKIKLLILQAAHFVYLPVCRTVFQTWYVNFYGRQEEDEAGELSETWYISSFVLFFLFIIPVPYRTFRLIAENKPRGSTEDPEYTFDEEGHRVKLTDAVFEKMTNELMDTTSPSYNPWAGLFQGYERPWAEFSVFVMLLKVVITSSITFLQNAKIMQTSLALFLMLVWTMILKMSAPYLSEKADATDFAAKLSQLVTILLSLIAVLMCHSPLPQCSQHCYSSGEPGNILGILTNVFAGICLFYTGLLTVQAMPCYMLRLKNQRGMFSFTEHNPASHLDEEVPSLFASLIYNLRRDKKYRVWFPFWDGVFEEMAEATLADGEGPGSSTYGATSNSALLSMSSQSVETANKIGMRWQEIKAQAMDAGSHRVYQWIEQSDVQILAARNILNASLEGIDVYCDTSCMELDAKGECRELINTSGGGDKVLSSSSFFAKCYTVAFPLRAMIVWDDCPDRAMLYDDDILKLVRLNQTPQVQDKCLMRKQLRTLKGTHVNFQFWKMETKRVKNGVDTDKDGNKTQKYKSVQVKMTYTTGVLDISQTSGKNTMNTAQTEFDLSAGFDVGVSYNDGWGRTSEGEGGSWSNESCSVGHSALGITPQFERGVAGCYQRDGMSRNPGINNLINENSGSMATGLVALDAMRQRYRDKRQADIAEKERVLTAKFWPLVYNNSDMEHHTLEAWLASNAPDLGATLHETQGQALEYLWARMAFVSESFSNLYWFTFWDDLWTSNYKMNVLKDKSEVFGSADPSCLCYNPKPQMELKALLEEHQLIGTKDKPPHLMFPELLDKLYKEMGRAEAAYDLTPTQKTTFLMAPWHTAEHPV